MAKSLLNNLLGRFGINLEKPITEILSRKEFDNKMLMYKIMSYKEISNNKVLVTYIPKLDYGIMASHNLDFIKLFTTKQKAKRKQNTINCLCLMV